MSVNSIAGGSQNQQLAVHGAKNAQSQQQAEGTAAVKLIQAADPRAIAAQADSGKGENVDIKV